MPDVLSRVMENAIKRSESQLEAATWPVSHTSYLIYIMLKIYNPNKRLNQILYFSFDYKISGGHSKSGTLLWPCTIVVSHIIEQNFSACRGQRLLYAASFFVRYSPRYWNNLCQRNRRGRDTWSRRVARPPRIISWGRRTARECRRTLKAKVDSTI